MTQLEYLRLTNIKVADESLEPISHLRNLKKLEVSNQFPTKEYAYLSVKLTETECSMFRPSHEVEIKDANGKLVYDRMIIGKRKPFLLSTKDQNRIEKYEKEFEKLISNGAQKLNEPVSLTPERKACYLQDPDGNWVELIEDNG